MPVDNPIHRILDEIGFLGVCLPGPDDLTASGAMMGEIVGKPCGIGDYESDC